MATSTDVAVHAGLSRSAVSQILNGREHLFAEDTVARVRASAAELGYRPSLAGRTLARGTSDIVITLLSNVTFNPRLRELVDLMTAELADAGLTNLLRFLGSADSLEDAVLGLKPYGVVSLTALPDAQRERLIKSKVHLLDQPRDVQASIDETIGRLQAEHLADSGFDRIAVVLPNAAREQSFAAHREAGVTKWADAHGIRVLPALHVELERGGSADAVAQLPAGSVGLAAYNDEIAIAFVGAAMRQRRTFPDDLGIVGIDNSPIARAFTPAITTVDYDIEFSAHNLVQTLLQGPGAQMPADPAREVAERLRIIQGETTRPRAAG